MNSRSIVSKLLTFKKLSWKENAKYNLIDFKIHKL